MSRIAETFATLREQGRTALIPFVTAGDPSLETTYEVVLELVDSGADLIELGVPFSDPMADGPTIQASSQRALEAGTTLRGVLDLVARLRQKTAVPVVLMGYYNPVLRFGAEAFAEAAAKAGVDALLLVDLPPEEAGELQPSLRQQGLDLITLLAPTTPLQRRTELAGRAEGFLYYVSMTGVTGTQAVDSQAIESEVLALRAVSRIPVAVGFGINTPDDAARIARFADAVVVGSALVKVMTDGEPAGIVKRAGAFVRALREGIDRHVAA